MSIFIPLPFTTPNGTVESAQGPLASRDGLGNSHFIGGPIQWGWDFSVGQNVGISAFGSGRVVSFVDNIADDATVAGFGNYVTIEYEIDGAANVFVTYAHLKFGSVSSESGANLALNSPISAGQDIGITGQTGTWSFQDGSSPRFAPHLHVHFGTDLTNGLADGSNDTESPLQFPQPTTDYSVPGEYPFGGEAIFEAGQGTNFQGSLEGETFFGTDFDDVFRVDETHVASPDQAGDVVYGGAGIDTVIYTFSSDSFSIQRVGDEILVQGPNGLDSLHDVEFLSFQDGPIGPYEYVDLSLIQEAESVGVISESGNGEVPSGAATSVFDRFLIWVGGILSFTGAQDDYERIQSVDGVDTFREISSGIEYQIISGSFIEFSDTDVLLLFEALLPDPVASDDHSDDRAGSTILASLDGTVSLGEIEVFGDTDFFQFSTQSGRTYAVVASPLGSSGVNPEVRIYNSAGQLVASNSDFAGGPSAGLSFEANGGTYYVEVSGQNGDTGAYGLGVSLLTDGSGGTAPADEGEPDVEIGSTSGRSPTHTGSNSDNTWLFSRSSSTEVFIVMNGGDDRAITGRRDDIVFGGDGDDEIETNDGDDLIDGGDDRDDIEGGGGDDGILGGRDDDKIDGGSGDDVIAGQHGDDRIDGGSGDDVISGGDGDDRIDGESGNDGILGDDGEDDIDGGSGDDVVYGGDDDDRIDGESGDDVLHGDDGDDSIRGGTGADRIDGGRGDDLLRGEEGNDNISGGSGDDEIRPGSGDDVIDGDGGSDTLSYEDLDGGAVINLETETAYGAEVGFDTFDSIDHVNGTDGDDVIIGDHDDNRINGESGRDIITGGGGNDEIDGGSSSDTAVYSGNRSDYTILASPDPQFDLMVIDNRPGSPDGTDLLDSIAYLQFADIRIRDNDALSAAPTAVNDAFEVSAAGSVVLDVLGNDSDPDGNPLSISAITSQPDNGFVYIVGDRIVFDPNDSFSGDEDVLVEFSYEVTDGTGWSNEGTVALTVEAIDTGPEVFVFNSASQTSSIQGFTVGEDHIDISSLVRDIDFVTLAHVGAGKDGSTSTFEHSSNIGHSGSSRVMISAIQVGDDVVLNISNSDPIVGAALHDLDIAITLNDMIASNLSLDEFLF